MTKVKKAKAVYSFRDGYRAAGMDPAAVAAELERTRAENAGNLTPEAVLKRAANPASPLHPGFNWDDSDAAREYRLHQARTLVRSVIVTYPDQTPRHVYVHVQAPSKDDGESGYHPMEVVARSPEMREAALEALRSDLAGAQRAVNELIEASRRAEQAHRMKKVEAIGRLVDAAANAAREVG